MRHVALCLGILWSWCACAAYAPVIPGIPLQFPRDFGTHPDFRTEWWYVTGWLKNAQGENLGFQVTFFRTKPDIDAGNPSAFTPRQILIAHSALSDPKRGRLWQDQRIRRTGFELAGAAAEDTHVWIERWSLRHAGRAYIARIEAEDFSLDLELGETQAPLLNGEQGFSRKGPDPNAASYYYSVPQLQVSGQITRGGASEAVTGQAWLDHEWSSEYLGAQAVGWEWLGINLDDGGALMAFRIRGADGTARWAGGTIRNAAGAVQILGPTQVDFKPIRRWKSARTGIEFAIDWRVTLPGRILNIKPLMDDQENDTRLSTGAIYWEGAVSAVSGGAELGRGYLELTGYGEPLRLR